LAPDGNSTEEIEYLIKKVQTWTDKIRTNPVNQKHAFLVICSTIIQMLLYPIAALNLTCIECNKIMWPLYKYGLQQMEICSSLLKVLRSGPTSSLGLNILCLYTMQGLHKLLKLIQFEQSTNIVGNLICLDTEFLVLELGLLGNMFSQDLNTFEHLVTPIWLSHP